MALNLKKSLVFFDLETTGVDPVNDRIVQISMLKCTPDGKTIPSELILMNPGIPISSQATAIHGIADEDVAHLPGFAHYKSYISDFMKDSDLGGYNMFKFDLPLLSEEFARCKISFPPKGTRFVDPQMIFFRKEPRNLSAAYQFYCGKTLEGAHNAAVDTAATYDVFLGQLQKYDDIGTSVEEISTFCDLGSFVDPAHKLTENALGEIVYTFGKNKGKPVISDPSYAKWVLDQDFPNGTKHIIAELIKGL